MFLCVVLDCVALCCVALCRDGLCCVVIRSAALHIVLSCGVIAELVTLSELIHANSLVIL